MFYFLSESSYANLISHLFLILLVFMYILDLIRDFSNSDVQHHKNVNSDVLLQQMSSVYMLLFLIESSLLNY